MAKSLAQIRQQLDWYSTQALPMMLAARQMALKATRKPERIEALGARH